MLISFLVINPTGMEGGKTELNSEVIILSPGATSAEAGMFFNTSLEPPHSAIPLTLLLWSVTAIFNLLFLIVRTSEKSRLTSVTIPANPN